MEEKKTAGRNGETAVASFLEKQGVLVLLKNFHSRFGEIDLIGKQEGIFLVVEVKMRSRKEQGSPCEAVDLRKQKKICRTFDFFRMKYHVDDFVPVRFDVVEVDSALNCHWIQNAFEYQGN